MKIVCNDCGQDLVCEGIEQMGFDVKAKYRTCKCDATQWELKELRAVLADVKKLIKIYEAVGGAKERQE